MAATKKSAKKATTKKATAKKATTKKATTKKATTKKATDRSGPQAHLPTPIDILASPDRPRFWLAKSEPEVYSIQDLARHGSTTWEGVRNYVARNFMRDDMAVGELVLFYHSNAEPPGVAGIARVSRSAYPDPHQFDPKSPYYDEGAKREDPRWLMVEVEHVETFEKVLPLHALQSDPALEEMLVIRKGMRLSVQPVARKHFLRVLELAGAITRVA